MKNVAVKVAVTLNIVDAIKYDICGIYIN